MLHFLLKISFCLIPALLLIIFSNSNLLNIFWLLSYYYLVIVLCITPIMRLFKKSAKYLVWCRRPIGILAWVFALLHMLESEKIIRSYYMMYQDSGVYYMTFIFQSFQNQWWQDIFWYPFYGFIFWSIAFLLLMILTVISNNISQKILTAKIWKKIQRLAYPIFLLVFFHIYFMVWWKGIYMYPALILIILRLLAQYYHVIKKICSSYISR